MPCMSVSPVIFVFGVMVVHLTSEYSCSTQVPSALQVVWSGHTAHTQSTRQNERPLTNGPGLLPLRSPPPALVLSVCCVVVRCSIWWWIPRTVLRTPR